MLFSTHITNHSYQINVVNRCQGNQVLRQNVGHPEHVYMYGNSLIYFIADRVHNLFLNNRKSGVLKLPVLYIPVYQYQFSGSYHLPIPKCNVFSNFD